MWDKISFFLDIFRTKYIWNGDPQTCEKTNRATQKVSILERRMSFSLILSCKFKKVSRKNKDP